MGCSNLSPYQIKDTQQPTKNFSSQQVLNHQTTVIKFTQPLPSLVESQTSIVRNHQKCDKWKSKQQKIKQLKNNKDFVQLSIQTSYCVNRLLNALAHNQILEDKQLKNLISKNNQILVQKQNRYKNLQARQQKMELQLKKQIEKDQKPYNSSSRKTYTYGSHNLSDRRLNSQNMHYHESTSKQTNKKNKNLLQKSTVKQTGNRQHQVKESTQYKQNKQNKHSKSTHNLESNYKSKFIQKIDRFRSQVNTLVAKENLNF